MATILSFLLLLLLGSQAWAGYGMQMVMSGGVAASAVSDGFVGTRAAVTDSVYQSGNDTPHSHYAATTTGTVSYIYVRRYDNSQDMTETKPAIWSADGSTLLASSTSCTATNPSTNLYRYTLSSPLSITASTTYTLGYATGDGNYYPPYAAGAGAIYIESGVSHSGCPTINDAVTHDTTFTTDGGLCIWASNDPNES